MSNQKKIIIILCVVLGIIFIVFFLMGPKKQNMITTAPIRFSFPKLEKNTSYENRIFDTSYMHEINIKISKADWEDMIANPLAKKKYKADVVLDGIKISNVSIKTKGNSSLKNIANGPAEGPASKRFSFKINFGEYDSKQSYYGLDVLNLNNLYGDASYLNDFVSYETFRQMNVPAPLCGFAYVKMNGQNFGLYSTVEEIGKAFFTRNNLDGNLYKPEQSHGSDSGASLTYKDDNPSSYVDIFNNAESIITDDDKKHLISALQKLNAQKDLDQALDTEEIIRYFVAHNYLLSYDSYTGKSIHNYYLAEKNGILSMLPWDYNLAFGRFNMYEDIDAIVNYGIDSPLNQAQNENRPMWNWILENEQYRNQYHQMFNTLLADYLEPGKLESLIDSTYEVVRPYVDMDISAFYTTEQVDKAIETLKKFIHYRNQSIRLQLDGKLATKTTEQLSENRIKISDIDLNDLGFVADDRLLENNQNAAPTPPQRNTP